MTFGGAFVPTFTGMFDRGGAARPVLPVTAGLKLWLDAAQITGVANGGAVSSWPDMSGNGNNATQEIADARPTYQTNVINGNPVVRFDGNDDGLQCSAAAMGNTFTVLAVWKPANTSATQPLIAQYYNSFDNRTALGQSTTSAFFVQTGSSFSAANAGPGTSWAINTATKSGTTATVYKNGISFGSGTVGATVDTRATSIGFYEHVPAAVNARLNGDIAEIIVYDTVLSDANRQAVELYLKLKYGL